MYKNDSINYKLPKLKKREKEVDMITDFYNTEVVNEKYIVRNKSENEENFKNRLKITPTLDLFSPIIDGIVSIITKKAPVVKGFKNFNLEDVDKNENNLHSFIKKVCLESVLTGACFVSVENNNEENIPYFKIYKYKDLLSYHYEDNELKQIVFREKIELKRENEFELLERYKYTLYNQRGGEVWIENENNKLIKQGDWENSLNKVPVVSFITGREVSKFDIKSKFFNIVSLNQGILNLQSQLINVLQVVGNPIVVIYKSGMQGKEPIVFSSRNALNFENKQAEGIEYLEISGKAVEKVERRIEIMKDDIDKMTFSILTQVSNRTVIDANENQVKNTGFMTYVSSLLENKFNVLLKLSNKISGKESNEEDFIEFKKDFDDVLFSKHNLDMLYNMVKDGNLSRETFWEKLKGINILKEKFESEEENELLEKYGY